MPFRQPADAGAQNFTSGGAAITAAQTSVTLQSASGFPAILANGQLSVTILDGGNPIWDPTNPLATPFEYQQVNGISGNVLTFGPGGGSAQRVAYAGTTPKSFFSGSVGPPVKCPIIAVGLLAEDLVASFTTKFDEQTPTSGSSITIPASGTIPSSYLGVPYRHIEIEWTARTNSTNGGDVIGLQLNLDSGANYDWNGFGMAASALTPIGVTTGATNIRVGVAAGGATAAGIAGKGKIEIIDAFETSFRKFVKADCVRNDASAFGNDQTYGDWHPATPVAITSITLLLAAGAFVAGSRITTRLKP